MEHLHTDVTVTSLHFKRLNADIMLISIIVLMNPFLSSILLVIKGYASRFAAPICENDCHHDAKEPTIAQLLQEKTLYSFSEWPKVLCHSHIGEPIDTPYMFSTPLCLFEGDRGFSIDEVSYSNSCLVFDNGRPLIERILMLVCEENTRN